MTKLLIASCFLMTNIAQIANAETHTDGRLLKAAFIYNFAKFTRWPENTWKQQNAPLNLCTIGKDELINELKRLTGKTIKDHPVITQSLQNKQIPDNCHLLYIASSEKNHYKNILESVHNKPILTISEQPHFARSGGMIEFFRKKDQTRFIINLGITRNTGLTVSSRLLNLALVINHKEAQ